MQFPPRWTSAQFAKEAATARELFRRERLDEPLARWKAVFEEHTGRMRRLLDDYGLADPLAITPERLAAVFRDGFSAEFRYLAAPPISADDLCVLADTTLAPKVLAGDPAAAQRVLETIVQAVDTGRFPWIAAHRAPTDVERQAAVLASAALLTRQRVQTDRANEGKAAQESAVKAFLETMGFKEVPAVAINTLGDAPAAGHFSGEALVGSRKADITIRLFDGRLMPVECKVSNSSTNSVKRLNNDAAVKAGIWTREFGTKQVVPAAVLSGVFKVHNLEQAQEGNLTIFWAHDLGPLREFIDAAR